MNQATIQSRCECQAGLWASLNQQRLVIAGWATDPRRGRQEPCTAHSIDTEHENFQVAWQNIAQYVRENYVIEKTIGKENIWRRREDATTDPVANSQ